MERPRASMLLLLAVAISGCMAPQAGDASAAPSQLATTTGSAATTPSSSVATASAVASSTTTATAPASVGASSSSLPVDPSITPISRSHPTPEAAEAFSLCNVNDATIGMDKVAAAGQIPHARDLPAYVPFSPQEPEIQTDSPAFVIEIRGDVLFPLSGWTGINPTCVVVGG